VKPILWFLILCFPLAYAEQLHVSLHAEKAILMNAKTGAVLLNKGADLPAYPASTTKIATCLYVLEHYSDCMQQIVSVPGAALASITPQAKRDSHYRSPPHWLETDGTHIGLKKGEEMSVHQLLHAALIASANDACNVLAMHFGTTVPRFMADLNLYLASIGCTKTQFNNPHGLHHPEHVTTARDLACMARQGLKIPEFRQIVKCPRYTCPRSNLEEERTFIQSNLSLRNGRHFDARVIGVKTGVTQVAGKNLVSAAQYEGRELIAVVLGCKTRDEEYQDIRALYDAAFKEPLMRREILPSGPCSLMCSVKGSKKKLETMLLEPLNYDFYPAEETAIQACVAWNLPPLPIRQGMCVGTVSLLDHQGTVLQSVPLLAAIDVKKSILWLVLSGVALVFFLIFFLFSRKP